MSFPIIKKCTKYDYYENVSYYVLWSDLIVCAVLPLPRRKVRESTGSAAPLPLLVKIAPDLNQQEKEEIATVVLKTKVRGDCDCDSKEEG